MKIREYTPNDLDALRRLHAAQGFGYPFPDLDSPLFIAKLILEDEGDDSPDELADALSSAGFSLRVSTEGREEAHRNSPPESRASTAAGPPRITPPLGS